ncbi:MAG TPA: class I SAM-dependent methyltransferase [Woeseiaceae bacterium]|nr:class I SAM-dependent methyltransferase [Woeseiaceae bacterium]
MPQQETALRALAFAKRVRRGILNRVHRYVLDRSFDEHRGVQTTGIHQPETLDLRGENATLAVEYEPTPALLFKSVIAAVPEDLSRFVFIDLGSGKGRVLLMAAELPFSRIEGVELSPKMHQIAAANVASNKNGGTHIISHNLDATEYEFPPEPFVMYLFNPFQEAVVARVLRNLERSFRQSPRPGYIVYVNARHRTVFDAADFLEEVPRSWLSVAIHKLVSPWPVALYRTIHTHVMSGGRT